MHFIVNLYFIHYNSSYEWGNSSILSTKSKNQKNQKNQKNRFKSIKIDLNRFFDFFSKKSIFLQPCL